MRTPVIVLLAVLLASCSRSEAKVSPPVEKSSPVDKINAEAETAPIVVTPLRGNITMLSGSGGNITVLTSPKGKLLVDCGIAVSKSKISAALAQLSPGPVEYLIDTHWHWDHTDGNAWVQGLGATIVGHENVVNRLSTTTRVEDWNHTFPPAPEAARPTVLIKTDKSLSFGDEELRLAYYGPAHTDGDISVYFVNADVLSVGDTWWNGVYPFIDIATGGSIGGMLRAAEANLAMAKEHTLVIGGHGPNGTRAELLEYRDMLAAVQASVGALKKRGMTLEETVAARPTASYDARWGRFVIGPELFTSLVYRSL